MHFEVLVEDRSGSIALECLLEKILGANGAAHSWNLHSYKGLGRIPKDLHSVTDPRKRLLLDQLPRLLQGYGGSFKRSGLPSAVIVVVDLDQRDCVAFKQELLAVLEACTPCPRTLFRIAIEESEAWLLGDRAAVKQAYPDAKDSVLKRYEQDSICGTWEVLADAVHPDGAAKLKESAYPVTGTAKCDWAGAIAPCMNVDENRSPIAEFSGLPRRGKEAGGGRLRQYGGSNLIWGRGKEKAWCVQGHVLQGRSVSLDSCFRRNDEISVRTTGMSAGMIEIKGNSIQEDPNGQTPG